jgi:uncharacterized protein YcbX
LILSSISIYPIKSLKGISLDSATVEERGLQYDRRWMLTTPEGVFFTQREFPRMATISVRVESGDLKVASDGHGEIRIPFEADSGERRQVTIWQSICEGLVYNGEVSEWFSDVLGKNCRLVHMPDTTRRGVNPLFNRGNEIVSFADGYPLMVLSEASLADLNKRIEESFSEPAPRHRNGDTPPKQGGELFEPLPMNRFRPNLVVADSEAFAEDGWKRIRIGEGEFRSTKPCERCVMTTIDQAKGEKTGKEPLRTLASYRMARDVIPAQYESMGVGETAVLFGQNLVPENPGATVRPGDQVSVIE